VTAQHAERLSDMLPASPRGATTKMADIDIFTAVSVSAPILIKYYGVLATYLDIRAASYISVFFILFWFYMVTV
jgi:hypothetical protein